MRSIGLGNGKHRPLTVSGPLLNQMIEDVGLPKAFPEAILSNNGNFASFVEWPKATNEASPPYLCMYEVSSPDFFR